MKRTVHESEHTNGAGEAVYVLTVYCASRPEREAVKAAALTLPVPAAFQPLPKPGEPFDAYEGELSMQARKTALNELIAESQRLGLYDLPPNCDGNRQFADASAVLAHAQHEAAIGGDECTAAACLITRGSD